MKKLLALVLALVMSMSLVTISNAAFSDADKIDHTEAVEVMNALGVINGMPDGSFNPSGNVTRAEMAKMITIIMLGDIDAAAFKGTTTDLTDINGHWAEGYIKYCYSQGVIAGRGDGTFAPNANVTAVEAAKMLLVAIGYNATVQGYVGGDWSINVIRDAQISKFFDDLSVTSTKVLTRDEAAQMIYNAVNAKTIKKSSSVDRLTGKVTDIYEATDDDLLKKTFGAKKEITYLTGISFNSDNSKFTYSFDSDAKMGAPVAAADAYDDVALSTTNDYSSLFGQKVSVVYKVEGSKRTVYGIYAEGTVLASGVLGDITDTDGNALIATDTDTEIKIGKVKYKLEKAAYDAAPANAVNAYTYDGSTTPATGTTLANVAANQAAYYTFDAIDNDADGKIDCFVVHPYTVSKVTYVGSTSITATNAYSYDKDTGLYSYSSVDYKFPKVVKGDYVLIPSAGVSGGAREVSVIDVVEGKVTAAKTSSVKVNDTWYEKNGKTVSLDSTYKLNVANGYIFGVEVIESASNDLLYVQKRDAATALTGIKAKVMFADGKVEVIEISKLNGSDVSNGDTVTVDALYTYAKKTDGTYEVKAVSSSNLAGNDVYDATTRSYTAATSAAAAKLGDYAIADDAVIFLKSTASGSAKYSVISGADLKGYSSLTVSSNAILVKAVNGAQTVKAAGIVTSNVIGSSTVWGYVTSAPYQVRYNDATVYYYTTWTANGEVEVYSSTSAAKGTVVDMIKNTDGTYSVSTSAVAVAITGYNDSDKTLTAVKASDASAYANNLKITNDTVILYVNSKDKTGVEGGEIAVAQTAANGAQIANAYAYVSSGDLKAVVFDVNNNWGDANTPVGVTVAAPAAVPAATNGITVASMTADKTKAAVGDVITYTVTYSGTASAATTITFSAGTNSTVLGNATFVIANGTVVAAGTTVTFKAVVTTATDVTAASVALS